MQGRHTGTHKDQKIIVLTARGADIVPREIVAVRCTKVRLEEPLVEGATEGRGVPPCTSHSRLTYESRDSKSVGNNQTQIVYNGNEFFP